MAVWFDATHPIKVNIEQVKSSLSDLGEHYVSVVGHMPGMTSVELVDQDGDSVTIRTNEGLMKRTNIVTRFEEQSVVVEFDEEYEAGTKVTATSHFLDEFTSVGAGVSHRLVISDVAATGFLGFLYRRFGSAKMGNAFLRAYSQHYEQLA